MGLSSALRTAASGLTAQRLRMDAISNNLANANTTRTANGGPYKREMVVFEPMLKQAAIAGVVLGAQPSMADRLANGVRAVGIVEDPSQGKLSYEPGHPDANAEGYVEYPNVNVVSEMTDMIAATRSYEANVAAMQSIKQMALKALELGRA